MSILHLDAASLRNLIKKLEQRSGLLAELKKIEQEIFSLAGEKPASASAPNATRARRKVRNTRKKTAPRVAAKATPQTPKRRKRRGGLTTKIVATLKKAGSAGLSVPEIARKIHAKPQNIHVWFSSTGKSIPEVKKEGEGRQARLVHAG